MNTVKTANREGFWYSKYEPDLPMPEPTTWNANARNKFLVNLLAVEGKAVKHYYRGGSTCRICQCHPNGSITYEYRDWTWPEGYMHYITEHKVKPSPEFEKFVNANA